jgi:hypothetical protein
MAASRRYSAPGTGALLRRPVCIVAHAVRVV